MKALERMMPSEAQWNCVRIPDEHDEGWIQDVKNGKYSGLVISGSAACPEDKIPWVQQLVMVIRDVTETGIPTFGLCFGHQLLAHAWGGKVERKVLGYKIRDICEVALHDREDAIPSLGDSSTPLEVFSSHQDQVTKAPPGWDVVAHSDRCPIQALRAPDLPIFSVQWHPEADMGFLEDNPHPDWEKIDTTRLTELSGNQVLREFLRERMG